MYKTQDFIASSSSFKSLPSDVKNPVNLLKNLMLKNDALLACTQLLQHLLKITFNGNFRIT
jgi:hypothetical protein